MQANNGGDLLSRNILIALFTLNPLFILFWYKGYFILISMGLALTIMNDIVKSHGRLWYDSRPKIVCIFFVLPLVSSLWSRYPDESLWRGALVLINLAIFYLALRANAKTNEKLMQTLVIITPLIMALTFAIIFYKYGSIRPDSKSMSEVVGSLANVGPALVVLCIPYLLVFRSLAVKKSMLSIALGACVFVVLLSQSRGGFLMLAIVFPLTLYFLPESRSVRSAKTLKCCFAGLIVAGAVFFFLGFDRTVIPVIERFEQSQLWGDNGLSSATRGKSDYRRTLMYVEGINALREEPLLGIGYGSLKLFIEDNNPGLKGIVSHNLIITAWGELGLPGLIVLLWLLVSIINGLRKCLANKYTNKREKRIAAATLVAFLVVIIHAQFRPLLNNPMFPVLLAQAYTIMRMKRIHVTAENRRAYMSAVSHKINREIP